MGVEPARVAILVHMVGPGGGETIAVESAIRLDPDRFQRLFCIGRGMSDHRQEPSLGMLRKVRESGADVLELNRRSRLAIWAWWPLLRRLRRERVDILHGHMFGSNVWACLLGRLARVPVVVCHEHMRSYTDGRLRTLVDRWLIARWSDAFVAVSEAGLKGMIEVERIDPKNVVLLRNGVSPFAPGDPTRVRKELGIEAEQPVVVAAGTLRPEKAYEVLIEATSLLSGSTPGLRVLIAGGGGERPRLEDLISRLGLSETVTLLGARDDVPDLLAAADIAVCCSDFEGGPLSVMEYMGAALPVVATRVGGLPEIVRDGETGILVPPRDPDALAGSLGELIGDPERRRRLGEAGREVREREYGIETFIDRLQELYERLLAESR